MPLADNAAHTVQFRDVIYVFRFARYPDAAGSWLSTWWTCRFELSHPILNLLSLICVTYIEIRSKFPFSFDDKIILPIVLGNARSTLLREWRPDTKSLLAVCAFGNYPQITAPARKQCALQMLRDYWFTLYHHNVRSTVVISVTSRMTWRCLSEITQNGRN